MKFISFFFFLHLLAPACVSAAAPDFTSDPLPGFLESLTAEPPAAPEPARSAQPREWTVMVFMNGKNDLSDYALADMKEMEAVGSDDRIAIVTEFAQLNRPVKRYYVERDPHGSPSVRSKLLMEVGNADMGDWRHLAEFAKWTRANFPARKYLLIVWNHGTGWRGRDLAQLSRGISEDWETENEISTVQLAQAMREIGRVDILAFDACLMQMAEVAYELRDYAEVIVGSEETAPAEGYPYEHILRKFAADPSAGPEAFGRHIVNMTSIYYGQRGRKTTQSAIRATAMGGLIKLTDSWARAALAAEEKSFIKYAYYEVRSYGSPDHRDLFHLAELAARYSGDAALAARTKELNDYISSRLVIASAATLRGYMTPDPDSHGLAVNLPAMEYYPAYDALAWARDGIWDDMIKGFNDVDPAAPPGFWDK